MKRVTIVLLMLLLVACAPKANKEEKVELKVIAPKGAAALALVFAEGDINFVDGTDALSAAFLNPNPEYDVIIAPLNMGAKIITESENPYRLLGIVTWGNLYFVENRNVTNGEIALFGEGAVPQKIVNTVLDLPEDKITYYSNVSEAQMALLSGSVQYALLAEPAYSATQLRAADSGVDLVLVYDLQEEWANVKGVTNYPQAAVFVLESSYEANTTLFEAFENSLLVLNDYPENEVDIKEKLTGRTEEFGVPAEAVVMMAWDNLNLEYKPAKTVVEEIEFFLELFNILNISDFFTK